MHAVSLLDGREENGWQVNNLANELGRLKTPEKGEQLYRAYLASLETGSVDNLSPLLQAQQQYAQFLDRQADFRSQAAAAIDAYRESVVAAQGPDTNAMSQVWILRIDLARTPQQELRAAEELVRLEESMAGDTSRPYLQAIQRLAKAHRASGNSERALSLEREAIHLADLT